MRCIRPLRASQNLAGDIVYSTRQAAPGLVGFSFECRKCLPCRLNLAREKAVRCFHESKMVDESMFLTLTYDEKHLSSSKLVYRDFQLFMKSLRLCVPQKINYMVTGEYGELNKRPHWHAIIFNYKPGDFVFKYQTDRGDRVWSSKFLDSIWEKGNVEFGDVTIDSAGYVARYAAKKLVHGYDGEHDFEPIHKTSSKRAIGRSWIEKYWKHTFENGFVFLPNGEKCSIPRYYVDWAKVHKNDIWVDYVTGKRQEMMELAERKARKEELDYLSEVFSRRLFGPRPLTRAQVKETILKSKFKRLLERLKL